MKRACGILLWLALAQASAAQEADPPEPKIQVVLDKASHSLTVINSEQAPYTLAFDFYGFQNARVNCDNPCLKVIPPGSYSHVLTFRRLDAAQAWYFYYRYHVRIGDYRARINKKHIYELPFARGQGFMIGQGYNGAFTHTGDDRFALDILMPEGTPVHAARAGKVVWVVSHFKQGGLAEAFKNRGNQILVLHQDGSLARYYHLRYQGAVVKVGQEVQTGALLGYSGNTGYSSQPHLHFDLLFNQDGRKLVSMPNLFRTSQGIEILKAQTRYTRP